MHSKSSDSCFITNSQLEERELLLSSVNSYDIFLNLGKDNYSGRVKINLKFTEQALQQIYEDSQIILDYQGEVVNSISINLEDAQQGLEDEKLLEFEYLLNKIKIRLKDIKKYLDVQSRNITLAISFKNDYSKIRAEGIVKWSEEEQGRDYIYCQGEVGCTSMIFPCVDQVNYRSFFTLTVQHPMKWMVSSHVNMYKQEKIYDEQMITYFPQVQMPFPTYLFGLYAGDYTRYTQKYNDSIELNVYCRQNLKKFLDLEINDYFQKIKFAINYMEMYTKVDYFFEKFDLFFCPWYKDCGMETLGCISLNEDEFLNCEDENVDYDDTIKNELIQRYEVSDEAEVLFHEIAHQWFGNYVSIKWWNDLYIKEGLANFFSCKILGAYFNNEKGSQLIDELGQFDFLDIDINQKRGLIHEKYKYQNYFELRTHDDVTYMKSMGIFLLLENKIYGKERFQYLIQQILQDFKHKSISSKELLTYFNDPLTEKLLSTNGYLSIEGQNLLKIKQKGNMHLTQEEIAMMNLQVFVINKSNNQVESVSLRDIKKVQTNKFIYILNTFDNHMVQQKLDIDILMHIDIEKLMFKFNQQLRASIWKGIIYLCDQNEWVTYLNRFFLNNLLSEQDNSVLHILLDQFIEYCDDFTNDDEIQLISLLQQEKSEFRKQILLTNIIEYLDELKNLQIIENKYLLQVQSLGPIIEDRLKGKIKRRQNGEKSSSDSSDSDSDDSSEERDNKQKPKKQ